MCGPVYGLDSGWLCACPEYPERLSHEWSTDASTSVLFVKAIAKNRGCWVPAAYATPFQLQAPSFASLQELELQYAWW